MGSRQRKNGWQRLCYKHGIEWEKKGTHEKHLSVLDFEKQERQKEVAELEQTVSGSKEELADILHQQIAAGQETEQIRKEGEASGQEVSELTATNHLQKESKNADGGQKLLSENEKIGKTYRKMLQQDITKYRYSQKKSWNAIYMPMMKIYQMAVSRAGKH